LRDSTVLIAIRTSVWIIPDAGLMLYWYYSTHVTFSNRTQKHRRYS